MKLDQHHDLPAFAFRAEFIDREGNWDGYSYAIKRSIVSKEICERADKFGDKAINGIDLVMLPQSVTKEIDKKPGRYLRTNRDHNIRHQSNTGN